MAHKRIVAIISLAVIGVAAVVAGVIATTTDASSEAYLALAGTTVGYIGGLLTPRGDSGGSRH